MKITVQMMFDSVDDLVSFYERVRTDDPVDHVDVKGIAKGAQFTEEQIDKAIAEADFASLVTPQTQGKVPVTEEIPVQPEPVAEPEPVSVHSRDEVKAFCTQSRVEKGIKIKDILLSLGVGSFKELPDEKLDALYDAVKAARGD